jgi:hypothetical protein
VTLSGSVQRPRKIGGRLAGGRAFARCIPELRLAGRAGNSAHLRGVARGRHRSVVRPERAAWAGMRGMPRSVGRSRAASCSSHLLDFSAEIGVYSPAGTPWLSTGRRSNRLTYDVVHARQRNAKSLREHMRTPARKLHLEQGSGDPSERRNKSIRAREGLRTSEGVQCARGTRPLGQTAQLSVATYRARTRGRSHHA